MFVFPSFSLHVPCTQLVCFGLYRFASRLCDSLNVKSDEGVVRLSAVHYNTADEVESVVAALDRIFKQNHTSKL